MQAAASAPCSTAPPPPALFSTKDLARRKSITLSLSSAPAGRAVDVDLTAWLNKSKLQLEKAAKAVTKAVKLANQEHIDSEEVTALAARIAAKPPTATLFVKQAARAAIQLELKAGLDLELDLFALLAPMQDVQEAALAFREKRAPQFSGQ